MCKIQSALAYLVLCVAVVSCSKQETEAPLVTETPAATIITGRVFKGLVQSTTVTAYELLASGEKGNALASHTTDLPEDQGASGYEPGRFILNIGEYEGAVLLEASGETSHFIDEATGAKVLFTSEDSLSAIVPTVKPGSAIGATISPFTEFTTRLALCPTHKDQAIGVAHEEALREIQDMFKLRDVSSLEPASLTGEKDGNRADFQYALALAILSQDALNRAGPGKVMTLIRQLGSDFEDCKADAQAHGKPIQVGAAVLPSDYYQTSLATAALTYGAAHPEHAREAAEYAVLLGPKKTTIRGMVMLGPVGNGAVSAAALRDDGSTGPVLGTAVTGTDGTFKLTLSPYIGAVVLFTEGGAYTEEATGKPVSLPRSASLRAVIPMVQLGEQHESAMISPPTEWAYRSLHCSPGETIDQRWNAALTSVANFFGVPDFEATPPIDLTAGTSEPPVGKGHRYGLLHAAISKLGYNYGLDSYALTAIIGNDFSDCSVDGINSGAPLTINGYSYTETIFREGLAEAAYQFVEGAHNQSGLEFSDFKESIAAFGGHVKGNIRGQVYKGIADNYQIAASDWRGWLNQGEVARTSAEEEKFQLEIFDYFGPLKLTAQGAAAVYRDEELQVSIPFGANTLSALVPNFRNGDELAYVISPLSDFAFTLAACYVRKGLVSESNALSQANTLIAAHFGVADFYAVTPASLQGAPYAGAISDPQRFTMALSGLSRLAQDINQKSGLPASSHITSIDLVTKLSSDLANDCMWDGVGPGNKTIYIGAYGFTSNTMRIELAEAMAAWMRSEKNTSAIPLLETNAYATYLSENGSSLFPGIPNVTYDTDAPSIAFSIPAETWVKGDITLIITATDASPMASLTVTGPAAMSALPDLDANPNVLTVAIPTTAYPNGRLAIWVKATDNKENTAQVPLYLNIDNQVPVLSATGFRTNKLSADIQGTWAAPSGVTWLTVVNLQTSKAVHAMVSSNGTFSAAVTLPYEGHYDFAIHLLNKVESAASMNVAVTRDTTGPAITMLSGTHQGFLGEQVFAESDFTDGTFVLHARYPTPGVAFEFPDTQFAWVVTDSLGKVSVINKRLLKSGILVTPGDASLSHLGSSVFGNEIHRSITSGPNATLWTMRVQASDDLGNSTQKDFSFRIKIHAPIAVSTHRPGEACGGSGIFLTDYNYDCAGHMKVDGLNRADFLKNGADPGRWVNGKISVMMIELRNEAADLTVFFNPTAFASDYQRTFSILEIVYQDWDTWLDSEALPSPANGCSADARYYAAGGFDKCVSYGPYTRRTVKPTTKFTPAVSLVVTDQGNNVVSPTGLYEIPPGEKRRIFMQLASPLAGMQGINRLCTDIGSTGGTNGYRYWGTRQYLWYDLTGVFSGSYVYKIFQACNVSYKLEVTYEAGKNGQTYRALVSTEFDPSLTEIFDTGITLPYFNNKAISLAADTD